MNRYEAEQLVKATEHIAENIGKVAAAFARLAQAAENANEIAVKHNQWLRHE